MGHHVGTEAVGQEWSRLSNDMIHRVCTLLPDNFVAVGQLPQVPGVPPKNCIPELERIAGLGFVGVNLNPDTSGGHWNDPPLTDRYWYPIYEKLVELKMPAMIHVTGSCNPAVHHTGAHYINADTTAFMQLIQGNLFKDFPDLKFVIPHGGGAVPYHWGRYRGLAMMLKKPTLAEHLMKNVFFDTCVYHLPGIALLTEVIPVDNILFGSEMLGAVRDIDPETGTLFRRHQALYRPDRAPVRRRPLQAVRRQCAQGLSAPGRAAHQARQARPAGLILFRTGIVMTLPRLNGLIQALESGQPAFSLFAPMDVETALALQPSKYDGVGFRRRTSGLGHQGIARQSAVPAQSRPDRRDPGRWRRPSPRWRACRPMAWR